MFEKLLPGKLCIKNIVIGSFNSFQSSRMYSDTIFHFASILLIRFSDLFRLNLFLSGVIPVFVNKAVIYIFESFGYLFELWLYFFKLFNVATCEVVFPLLESLCLIQYLRSEIFDSITRLNIYWGSDWDFREFSTLFYLN